MPTLPAPYNATIAKIFRHYETNRDNHESRRLGASQAYASCDRRLWYSFRWAANPEYFDGRMLRLFETGHREETRMLDNLEAVGIKVQRHDPATGEQWTYTSASGHVVAKLDGRATGFDEAPRAEHLIECKTHKASSWKDVVKSGVEKSKPGHFAQMQIGMLYSGIERGYYMAHNKDTDELYQERIELDLLKATQMAVRLDRITTASNPPPKLHENPHSKMGNFECGRCPAYALCHSGAGARRTCRTCCHATPVHGGGWRCELREIDLDVAAQKAGCAKHLFIPSLVPGEQIDCDTNAMTITYRLPTGETWTDGAAA